MLKLGAYNLLQSGYITEHDYKIASKLAYVLAGGEVPEGRWSTSSTCWIWSGRPSSSLAGEPKSQQRMHAHADQEQAASELSPSAKRDTRKERRV